MAASNDALGFTEGAGANIATHAITEGGETRHVERVAPASGVIEAPTTASIAATSTVGLYPAAEYLDCQGKGRIVINSVLSVSGESAGFRIAFYDASATLIGYTEEQTITDSEMDTGSSTYWGELIIAANEVGAASYKIRLTTIPDTAQSSSGVRRCNDKGAQAPFCFGVIYGALFISYADHRKPPCSVVAIT